MEAAASKTSFLKLLKAVFWSFFGVRREPTWKAMPPS